MIDLACPLCRTPLQLVTRQAPAPLTIEQRMYTWLFDVILDRTASADEKARARGIMNRLGVVPKSRRRNQRGTRHSTFGDLIRLVIHERAHGPEQ